MSSGEIIWPVTHNKSTAATASPTTKSVTQSTVLICGRFIPRFYQGAETLHTVLGHYPGDELVDRTHNSINHFRSTATMTR